MELTSELTVHERIELSTSRLTVARFSVEKWFFVSTSCYLDAKSIKFLKNFERFYLPLPTDCDKHYRNSMSEFRTSLVETYYVTSNEFSVTYANRPLRCFVGGY